MSSENLEEYRAKLKKSKQQLKRVRHLLTSRPNNDNLISLKKELEQVIQVTDNFLRTKEAKTRDTKNQPQIPSRYTRVVQSTPAASAIVSGTNTPYSAPDPAASAVYDPSTTSTAASAAVASGVESSIDSAVDPAGAAAGGDYYSSAMQYAVAPSDLNAAAVAAAAADNTAAVAAGHGNGLMKDGKPMPREWGIEKPHYENKERCRVKYTDKKWCIAQVRGPCPDPHGSDMQAYRVEFLDWDREAYITTTNNMRTYVPPLVSEVTVSRRVRAIWDKDGLFYPATVEEILSDGNYLIKYDRYNEQSVVPLYDLQLLRTKKGLVNKSTIVTKDKKGMLHIAEKPAIPQHLWMKDNETEEERKKRKNKIKQIKKQHKLTQEEVTSKNKQNAWQKFMGSGIKKSKKRLKGTLIKKGPSIFESPDDVEGMVGSGVGSKMTSFEERTHFHHLRKNPTQPPTQQQSASAQQPSNPAQPSNPYNRGY